MSPSRPVHALVAVVALVAVISGCGGGSDGDSGDSTAPAADTIGALGEARYCETALNHELSNEYLQSQGFDIGAVERDAFEQSILDDTVADACAEMPPETTVNAAKLEVVQRIKTAIN
jgi:hypothetical protein